MAELRSLFVPHACGQKVLRHTATLFKYCSEIVHRIDIAANGCFQIERYCFARFILSRKRPRKLDHDAWVVGVRPQRASTTCLHLRRLDLFGMRGLQVSTSSAARRSCAMKGSRLRQDDCSEGQNGYGDKRDSECLEPGHVEFCLS
jgi:hypothetical protein